MRFLNKSIWHLVIVAAYLVAPMHVYSHGGPLTPFWGDVVYESKVQSYRSLRYVGVVGQTTWYTCGPAAVATLLSEYYNMAADEAEMLALAWEAMERVGADLDAGITMLALKDALLAKGIGSQGYRVTLDQLVDYFARGGLPVIMHVTRPQPHYVVGVGVVNGVLVIADPAFGSYMLTPNEFGADKGFEGNILVTLPDPSAASVVRANQIAALERANQRAWQLTQLREGNVWTNFAD